MTPLNYTGGFKTTSKKYQEQRTLDYLRIHKPSVQIMYYLDSYDISKMIEGIRYYEHNSVINRDFFANPSNLVHALLYFGTAQTSKIGILPGHQEEVSQYIKSYFAPLSIDENVIKDLFDTVGLSKVSLKKETSKEEIREILEEYKDHSAQLYILNYLICECNWLKRASYLVNNRITIDQTKVDQSFAESDVFRKIYSFLEQRRPRLSKNNFRDAFSLYIMHFKLKEFEKNKKGELPIYFASTNTMIDIKNHRKFRDYFSIELEDGRVSVIQDVEFLIVDFLFNYEKEDVLYDQFRAFEKLSKTKVRNIGSVEEGISEDTESIIDFKIFNQLLFSKDILSERIKKFIDHKQWLNDEDVHKEKEKIEHSIFSKLSTNKTNLNILLRAWTISKDFKNKIQSIDLELFDRRNNPNLIFGLARFGFENTIDVNKFINDVALEKIQDENRFRDFQGDFITRVFKSLKSESSNKEDEQLGALLWVTKSQDLITKIFEVNKNYTRSLSIFFIYAISLLRIKTSDRKRLKVIQALESFNHRRKEYVLNIGLGYLYFNYWLKISSDTDLIPDFNKKPITNQNAIKAVNLTKKAIDWLKAEKDKDRDRKEERNTRYLYALNNYIYYVTRSAPEDIFLKAKKEFDHFLEQRSRESEFTYWQYRFEDTIALYYFRLAVISLKDKAVKKKQYSYFIDRARKHVKTALNNCIDDLEKIENASNLINNSKSELKQKLTGL